MVGQPAGSGSSPPTPRTITDVASTTVATFDTPWAIEFLPDGRFLLSERDSRTQSPGKLWLVSQNGDALLLGGLPPNTGVLDLKLDPQFSSNRLVYVSFLEPGDPSEPRVGRNAADMTRVPEGLALFRARLDTGAISPSLSNVSIIWRQAPKIVSHPGSGEPGGRIAFSPDARYLFITAGDRQEFQPVQDIANTIGKIVRIFPDGSIPPDNPFVNTAGARPDIWTLGHRNPYGLAFDGAGQLWAHEHGPQGGDEFNVILPGANYGWPTVSNGRFYGSPTDDIPDHSAGDGFAAPAKFWDPSIAPAGLIFYKGALFEGWRDSALLGALAGKAIHRLSVNGTSASEVQVIAMPNRIRDIDEASDGALWIINDGPFGQVARLTPVFAP